MKSYLRVRNSDVEIHVRVVAGSSKTRIVGELGSALKIRVSAIAEHGKANRLLLRYLSDLLEVPLTRMEIISGAFRRDKILRIAKMGPHEIASRIRVSMDAAMRKQYS